MSSARDDTIGSLASIYEMSLLLLATCDICCKGRLVSDSSSFCCYLSKPSRASWELVREWIRLLLMAFFCWMNYDMCFSRLLRVGEDILPVSYLLSLCPWDGVSSCFEELDTNESITIALFLMRLSSLLMLLVSLLAYAEGISPYEELGSKFSTLLPL